MRPPIRTRLMLLVFLALSWQLSFAGQQDPIVWLAAEAPIRQYTSVRVLPAVDSARQKLDPALLTAVAATLRKALESAQLRDLPASSAGSPRRLLLQTHILDFEGGSVGGRWVGFGGGAAFCVLRTFLIDDFSAEVIGEVVVANQLAVGGLFSAGAEHSVPKGAAEQTAKTLLSMIKGAGATEGTPE